MSAPCTNCGVMFVTADRSKATTCSRYCRRERIANAKRGARNPNARLTDEQVAQMHDLYREGATHREISRQLGTSEANVSNILGGKCRQASSLAALR